MYLYVKYVNVPFKNITNRICACYNCTKTYSNKLHTFEIVECCAEEPSSLRDAYSIKNASI